MGGIPRSYLSISEIASRIGVDDDAVLAWIHNGELSAIDVSKTRGGRARRRVRPSDLEEFEQSRVAKPPEKPVRRRRRKKRKAKRQWI